MNNKSAPPRLPEMIFRFLLNRDDYEHRAGEISEVFKYICRTEGKMRAAKWYWLQFIKSLPAMLINSTYWGGALFANYLKTAYRNLKSSKMFSYINITGLAFGIATCLLITIWVQRELSYDRFHSNADSIFRVERELFRDEVYSRWPIVGGQYKQALIDDIPEVENAVRFWRRGFTIKDYKNNLHSQEMFATDNSIFGIFDFSLAAGDESIALSSPHSIVLTEANALKYFGTTDVLGKTLSFEFGEEAAEFEVTGILNEVPENSHIKFDMLMSISTYPDERFSSWRSNYLYTYVMLKEGTDRGAVQQKLKKFVESRLEPVYGDLLVKDYTIHEVLEMRLFPITGIHLDPAVNWEIEPGGSLVSVYLFSSIALLILIIAGINFTNLSAARAKNRAKEVSLRKTIGANKSQLKVQFLFESMLMSVIALVMSILILLPSVDLYNSIFDDKLAAGILYSMSNITILFVIALLIGVLAGLYPAFFITRFDPAGILRGISFNGKRKSVFRRNLVVVQFIISITLLIGMMVVYNQMSYIQTKSIGFDKDNIVIIQAGSNQISSGYDAFRNELLTNSKIENVSSSADLPGDEFFSTGNVFSKENMDNNASMIYLFCDYDYIDTYKMKIAAGRKFRKDMSTDTAGTLILNEAAAKRLGWAAEAAVGKKLKRGAPLIEYEIAGVVKDYNFRSLREEIEPMIMILAPGYISRISVRIQKGDVLETIDYIGRKWKNVFPGEQFEYSFMDEQINRLYKNEKNMQNLLAAFSVLSVLVACLGLFGLTAYTTEEKTKEIGIRKTLGASAASILSLLTGDYLRWILISIVIAWPIAYYLMEKWLQNFAYHVDMDWMPFIISAGFALLIALVTVSMQVLKAASTNPVDALKHE